MNRYLVAVIVWFVVSTIAAPIVGRFIAVGSGR